MEVGNCCKSCCQAVKRQQSKTVQGGEKKTAAFPVLPFDFQGGIRQLLLTYTFFKESKEISSNLRNFFQSSKEICGTGNMWNSLVCQ